MLEDDAGLDFVDVLPAGPARAGEALLDILASDAGGLEALLERTLYPSTPAAERMAMKTPSKDSPAMMPEAVVTM